jgi:transposase-like protein
MRRSLFSSRVGRLRVSGVVWGSRRRRCGITSGGSKLMRAGARDLLSSEEREEIKKLRRENHELRRANEILKAASVFFAGELDPYRLK